MYDNPGVIDVAIQAFHGMVLGDKKLIVRRAYIGAKSGLILPPEDYVAAAAITEIPKLILLARENNDEPILFLMLNMVIPEELSDNQEYQYICGDIKKDSGNRRKALDLCIPGPTKKDQFGRPR